MEQHSRSQSQSRKAALCGVMAALSVVILCLGGLVPLATFACPMLAMLCILPAICEYGQGTALLLYGAAAILGLLLCPDKEIAFFYAFLGWYPAVRVRLDRIPKISRWLVKCGLFSASMLVMYALLLRLFHLEAVVEEFAEYSLAMTAALLVLGNVIFLVFDQALARITTLYQKKRKAG